MQFQFLEIKVNVTEGIKHLLAHFKIAAQNIQSPAFLVLSFVLELKKGCDPIDGSHQAPPSLRFSRQEHWSGLPFPSPMHESEK